EAELLKELARRPCQALSRDELRRAVAGRDADPYDRSIDMLVRRVRRKIEPDPKFPRYLITVSGAGYKLVARKQNAEAGRSNAQSTEPERRHITALCCELIGAMGLAIKLDPEDLSRITKDFQAAGITAITKMGGTIATVTPDQILAFFGYPEARE